MYIYIYVNIYIYMRLHRLLKILARVCEASTGKGSICLHDVEDEITYLGMCQELRPGNLEFWSFTPT